MSKAHAQRRCAVVIDGFEPPALNGGFEVLLAFLIIGLISYIVWAIMNENRRREKMTHDERSAEDAKAAESPDWWD